MRKEILAFKMRLMLELILLNMDSHLTEKEAEQAIKQGTYVTPTLIAEWAIPAFGKGLYLIGR